MKTTGIVRRMDDLGRIVIPKEIRRTIGVKEGDPLAMCIDQNGNLVLVPYRSTVADEIGASAETLGTPEEWEITKKLKAFAKELKAQEKT